MFKDKKIHLMGIGGQGMAPIAYILKQKGFEVQGSDSTDSNNYVSELNNLGIPIFLGHQKENVTGVDLVINSTAIKSDFPEMKETLEQKIPILHRSEALWELIKYKKIKIAISGSHGKTSTSAMLASIFSTNPDKFGAPSFIIGGPIFNPLDPIPNAHWTDSEVVIFEADESDKSFLNFYPDYTIITNCDIDHLDNYQDEKDVEDTFRKFCSQTQKAVITHDDFLKGNFLNLNPQPQTKLSNSDQTALQNIIKKFPQTFIDQGSKQNFELVYHLARILGFSDSEIELGISKYQRPKRRLEIIKESENQIIIDDYAHHPQEIKNSVQVVLDLKKKLNFDQITIIFQPHLYSRTKNFQKEFAQVLTENLNLQNDDNQGDIFDEVYIAPIYPAREIFDGETTPETISQHAPIIKTPQSTQDIIKAVQEQSQINAQNNPKYNHQLKQIILVMGAGDIWKILDQLK